MPLFLSYFLAQSSYNNDMCVVLGHSQCWLFDLFSSKYASSVMCWTSCQDYRDGHSVAPHPEESGPGADTKQMMLPVKCSSRRHEGLRSADGEHLLCHGRERGNQKGLGDHTEWHRDEQVSVRWNSTNTNTVDALSSPTKQVLLSSQQPYTSVTVLILQWRNGVFEEANDLSPKVRVSGTRLAPLHSKCVESEALSSSPR